MNIRLVIAALLTGALFVLSGAIPSQAQDSEEPEAAPVPEPEPDDKETEAADDEGESAKPDKDYDPEAYWKRYVSTYKKGRKWTHSVGNGIEWRTEVVSVSEDEAVVESTSVMNGNVIGEPTEFTVPLTKGVGGTDSNDPPPEWQEKEIEVKAGKFVGISTDGETWMMKKHPGIVLKTGSMELIEFEDVADEGEDEAETSSESEEDADEGASVDPDDHWERYTSTYKVGRSWTYELQGGMTMKTEVIKRDDGSATTKTTVKMNGNVMGEPTETEISLVRPKEEPAEKDDDVEWQEKEIECKAGTYVCISTDGKNWTMKKYPGIIVKSAAMELVEFNE